MKTIKTISFGPIVKVKLPNEHYAIHNRKRKIPIFRPRKNFKQPLPIQSIQVFHLIYQHRLKKKAEEAYLRGLRICLGNRCLDKGNFRGNAHLRKGYGERMKQSTLDESLKEFCLNAWKQLCSKKDV